MRLTHLFIHPLKSCRGQAPSRAYASRQGFLHDREWLLAKPDGRFITARTHPQLLRVEVELMPGAILLKCPGRAPIAALTTVYDQPASATVWKDTFQAWHGDERVDAWFSGMLGEPCRLLWLGRESQRHRESAGGPVSFADGYPYLLVNQASLDALNGELATPVGLRNFRPNLVVDADLPWEEDDWKTIQIGDIVFDVVKPCTRCILTTVDPDTAEATADREPLQTLIRLRTLPEGVCFGLNLVPRNEGMLDVGAPCTVLESRYEF